ncbi:MAG: hypothetical protein JWN08_1670 [Frankiales bacterium]|nr:hypothetical protein [Frankiales bacterium]
MHFYGETPAFVLLGGLVPQLLCAAATMPHAGTTDIDVQVDLEIASDSAGARRLEVALRDAGFEPEGEVWRWQTTTSHGTTAVVKFELLADQEDRPADRVITFLSCEALGAANIRGTGYAARDVREMQLSADADGVPRTVTIRVTGLAGFLLAKVGAAKSRSKPRDWYDIAYVLLHNDERLDGAEAVRIAFGPVPQVRTALLDLRANFDDETCQGTRAYVDQVTLDDPELDPVQAGADAMLAVRAFCASLL